MKRIFAVCACFFILLFSPPVQSAALEKYAVNVKDLDFTIELQDDYYVITRETPSDDPLLESFGIVDSVNFRGTYTLTKFRVKEKYKDPKTGLQFTLPEKWYRTALNNEREFIKAKFTTESAKGTIILYGSADFFDYFPESKNSRDGFGNNEDLFSTAEVAELFNCDASKVSKVYYDHYPYYKVEAEQYVDVGGVSVLVEATYLFRIDNGYLYWFQTNAEPDSEAFGDFEELVSSVEYPSVTPDTRTESSKPAAPSPQTPLNEEKSATKNPKTAVYITVIIFIIQITLALLFRFAIYRRVFSTFTAAALSIVFTALAVLALYAIFDAVPSSYAYLGLGAIICFIILRIIGKAQEQQRTITSPEKAKSETDEPTGPITELKTKSDQDNKCGVENEDDQRKIELQLKRDREALNYYKNNVVLVSSDRGKFYHVYGCRRLDLSSCWITERSLADAKGFRPCPDCYCEKDNQ